MDSNFSYSNLLLEDTDSIVEGDSSSSCIGTSTGTNSGNRDFSEGLRALVVDSLLGHWETTPLLKKYHYEVTNVLGGEEVLNLLRQKPGCFDLVISEVNLPGMSGFELLKSITKEFLTLPVFLMSKDCKPEMVKKGIMKGASYYLRKPLAEPDIEKLWQHVYLKRLEKKVDNKNKDQNESLGQDSSKKQKEKTPELSKKNDPRKNPLSIDISCPPAPNSSNIVWDDNLHRLFVQAVEHLGINGAEPKKILNHMRVRDLTRAHVASHLQKYKMTIGAKENINSAPSTSGSQSAQPSLVPLNNNGVFKAPAQQSWAHWATPNLEVGTHNMFQSVNPPRPVGNLMTGNMVFSAGGTGSSFGGSVPQPFSTNFNNNLSGIQKTTNTVDPRGTLHIGPTVRGPILELPNKPSVVGGTTMPNLNPYYVHEQSSTSAPILETYDLAAEIPNMNTTGFTTGHENEAYSDGKFIDPEFDISTYLVDYDSE